MPQSVIDLIAAWAPLILIIGTMLFLMRRGGLNARGPSGRSMIELYELQLGEMTRNAVALERIAQVLERRTGT